MSDNDHTMFGVFGPGDGKPVAVYSDGDEAAREKRRRFGDGGAVFAVTLSESELKKLQAPPVPDDGESRNIANRHDEMRARARAELYDEVTKELLKEELRPEVEKEVRASLAATGKVAVGSRKADSEAAAKRVETAIESHATLTEQQTGEKPPEGEIPPSGVHTGGPAPHAVGKADEVVAQPIVATSEAGAITETPDTPAAPEPADQRAAAKAAAENGSKAAKEAKTGNGKPKATDSGK
jgi:hypothetical protein